MNEKLSYEEWCKKYLVDIDPAMIEDLKQFHGIDAIREVEALRRSEYELYINGGFENILGLKD